MFTKLFKNSTKQKLQNLFWEEMRYMDFEHIQKRMEILNWTWWFSDRPSRVPHDTEIRELFIELFYSVLENFLKHPNKTHSSETGGCMVIITPDKQVFVRFVL